MFSSLNLALNGLFPGLLTSGSIANLGHYDVEVTIQPVVSSGGGGYVPVQRGQKPDRYKVTIRVKFGLKSYEEVTFVDDSEARVLASLKGIETFTEDNVMVSLNNVQIFEENVVVTASLNSIK